MKGELIKYALVDIATMAVLGYLFYRSILAMVILVLIGTPLLLYGQRKQYSKRQKMIMEEQFKDAILALAASLRAGYSVENSFVEVQRELVTLYGEKSIMAVEVKGIIKKLKLQAEVSQLLEELGQKCDVEDIKNFANVFKIAKRSGGDMVAIISRTAKTIGDKFDMQREIATMLAAKRLEQRLMLVMPMAILVYISIFNPGFLDILYEGMVGRLVMSACLVVYIAAFLIGEKIVDIDI